MAFREARERPVERDRGRMNPTTSAELILRDVHLPPAPEIWPPAWGWWLLLAVLLPTLTWLGLLFWRRLQMRRQRARLFALLGQFERAETDEIGPAFLAGISRLLRRIALLRYPRSEIAALSGIAWLRFLDRSGGDGRFERGPGRVLADGPYRRTLGESVDRRALIDLVREWIDINSGRQRA